MKRPFVLINEAVRRRACQAIMEAPDGYGFTLAPPTRNLKQNALLWPLLQAVSKQVDWYGQKLTDENWKDVFSAALRKQKVVPGLDGNFVVCGQRTSKMSKAEFADLVELIYCFGAQHNVKFSCNQS